MNEPKRLEMFRISTTAEDAASMQNPLGRAAANGRSLPCYCARLVAFASDGGVAIAGLPISFWPGLRSK